MDEWLLDGWERPIGNGELSAPSDPEETFGVRRHGRQVPEVEPPLT